MASDFGFMRICDNFICANKNPTCAVRKHIPKVIHFFRHQRSHDQVGDKRVRICAPLRHFNMRQNKKSMTSKFEVVRPCDTFICARTKVQYNATAEHINDKRVRNRAPLRHFNMRQIKTFTMHHVSKLMCNGPSKRQIMPLG